MGCHRMAGGWRYSEPTARGLVRPSQYLLLYGHTGLPSSPSGDPSMHPAMFEVVGVLFASRRDALGAGEIDTNGLEAAISPGLRAQLAEWRDSTAGMAGFPDGALAACMIG